LSGRSAQRGRRPGGARGRSSASLCVRAAAPGELDRVAALWTLLLAHHAGASALAPARHPEAALRAHLLALAADPDAVLLVAAREDGLAGFAALRVVRRPPLFAETERGEIEALYVREDERRRGVGRELVQASRRWLRTRGLRRVALQVAASNEPGQRFWRALGFGAAMDVLERAL
jgi:ribosomal protein S18 acetylase RimI-like enzyme